MNEAEVLVIYEFSEGWEVEFSGGAKLLLILSTN
jgi:hypothetical protein